MPIFLNPELDYVGTQANLVLAPTRITPSGGAIYGNLLRGANLASQQNLVSVLDAPLLASDASCGEGTHSYGPYFASRFCRPGLWVQTTGTNLSLDDPHGHGLDASGFGLLGGADHEFGSARVGVEAGVSRTNANDRMSSHGNVQSVHAGLYGFINAGSLLLSATADAAYDAYQGDRQTGIGDASSKPNGNTFSTGIQAAWALQLAAWQLTPKLGMLYQHQRMDSFAETLGSGSPLTPAFTIKGARSRYATLQPYGALSIKHTFTYRGISFIPALNVGYRYDIHGATPPTVMVSAQDGTVFALPGVRLGRGLGTLDARITVNTSASWNLHLGYQGLFARHMHDSALVFGLVKHF
jgi:outer membrane autotransporter protein